MESVFGWPLHISTSPNKRTLYNFPMQANGAEMLRLATMRLCDAGIVPIMLIHDGILFEETDREKIELAKEIMRGAGDQMGKAARLLDPPTRAVPACGNL